MLKIKPKKISVETSSICQLRCPSCPNAGGAIHPVIGSGFLKVSDFRKLIDENPILTRIRNAAEVKGYCSGMSTSNE